MLFREIESYWNIVFFMDSARGKSFGVCACSPDFYDAVLYRWEELRDVTISDCVQVRPSWPPANAQRPRQTCRAVGLPATRSHDAEWLFFFGRVLYKSIIRGLGTSHDWDQFALPLFDVMSYNDTMKLSSKHLKTLRVIFEDPVGSDIEWTDIKNLLIALGAELSEGRGSRVRVYLKGVRAVFHRPHPQKETEKGALKAMRRFLAEAGLKLEE